MASTTLSNLIEPFVFSAYVNQRSVALNALVTSGVIARSDQFDALCAAPGSIGEIPFFNPLAWSEANIASDNPAELSTPGNITTGAMQYRKEYREKDWGAMDLTARVIGANPMQQIGDGVALYWQTDLNKHATARLVSIATDFPDMVNTIGTDGTGNPTAVQSASLGAFLDTKQTMGDHRDSLALVIMHSQIYTNLMKLEPTNFTRPSDVQDFVTYNGARVIIDDGVTVTQGTNRKMYNTYLLAQGAFVYGEAAIPNATEVWRNPAAGNGFGEERLYSRKQFMLQPTGFSVNQSVQPATNKRSLSLAQWSATGTFSRVYDRKLCPIAILQSNA